MIGCHSVAIQEVLPWPKSYPVVSRKVRNDAMRVTTNCDAGQFYQELRPRQFAAVKIRAALRGSSREMPRRTCRSICSATAGIDLSLVPYGSARPENVERADATALHISKSEEYNLACVRRCIKSRMAAQPFHVCRHMDSVGIHVARKFAGGFRFGTQSVRRGPLCRVPHTPEALLMESPRLPMKFAMLTVAVSGMICAAGWILACRENERLRQSNDEIGAKVSELQSALQRESTLALALRREHEQLEESSGARATEFNVEPLALPPGPAQELPEFLLAPMNLRQATRYDRRELVLPPVPASLQRWVYRAAEGQLPLPLSLPQEL